MSKFNMNTQEKILDRALKMFNERGIEYVGLRELAAVLEMRVSNITYYFPTKDDLVHALSQELSKRNAVVFEDAAITVNDFLHILHRVFENHYEFRCLLRSFVHIMTQNKQVLSSYAKIKRARRTTIASAFHQLATSGYFTIANEETLNFLVSNLELISRYWISESAVFYTTLSKEQQMQQYLLMICNLLLPYSTSKAKKEIMAFREKLTAHT